VEEGVGFEPTELLHPTVFKTAALSHSAIPPLIFLAEEPGLEPRQGLPGCLSGALRYHYATLRFCGAGERSRSTLAYETKGVPTSPHNLCTAGENRTLNPIKALGLKPNVYT
jgi:hypothetical protein